MTASADTKTFRDAELSRLFVVADEMEEPIATVRHLLRSIAAIALTDGVMPDMNDADAVRCLLRLGGESVDAIDEAHGKLFNGLHSYAYDQHPDGKESAG